MHRLFNVSHRSSLSRIAAVAIALGAGLSATASFASSDEVAMSAPLTTTASAGTADASTGTAPATGRTRAEVVAEMQAARARGEMQAGHEWGIDVPPVQTRAQKMRLAAATR
ncbi:hypothetical protein GN316_19515 [Xylophilus sp. Kf1]|nr:hypothetical protein [Xylophilus sp. Kf1]